jgi:hypothetical protein
MIRLAFLTLSLLAPALAPAAEPPPIAAKPVTLARTATAAEIATAIREQTGITVDVSGIDSAKKIATQFDKTPFWTAVEKLAADTGCRVAVSRGGREIALTPLTAAVTTPPSSVDGPFRVVLKQVVARRDFETGRTTYQLHLEAQWEPRFPIYLIGSEPKVTTATADGKALTAESPTGRVASTGSTHPLTITLRDVPRSAKQVDELTGSFDVIAAHQLLPFAFDDLTADKPVMKEQAGVTVPLQPVKHAAGRAEFKFEMKYPASHPELESFEEVWAASNRLRVSGPNGRTAFEPTDYNTDSRGSTVFGNYAFAGATGQPGPLPAKLTGWKAVYETPSPLRKQTVTFTLKGIDLP